MSNNRAVEMVAKTLANIAAIPLHPGYATRPAVPTGRLRAPTSAEYSVENPQRIDPYGRDPRQALKMFSGKTVWPLDFRAIDLDLNDVARGICRQNRFVGQTTLPINVGWHSLNLSYIVPKPLRLAALVHDMTEAYLVDIPRPLKNHPLFAFFEVAEAKLFTGMAQALKLPFDTLPDDLHHFDHTIGNAEMFLYNPKGHQTRIEMGLAPERAKIAEKFARKIEKLIASGIVPGPGKEVATRKAWLDRFHSLHHVNV
jgi:hypothetical protein